MNIFRLIITDIRAKAEWLYGGGGGGNWLKACLTDGTLAMVVYRKMQWFQRWHVTPLAMVCNKFNVVFGGCVIGRGAVFGERLVLVHSQGIVINGAVRGGSDIKIEHQVTIGAEKNTAPVLGNNIFIGAGAKIIGAVKIGNDVKIGANAVVTKDVPDGATAVGIPARVIKIYGERV